MELRRASCRRPPGLQAMAPPSRLLQQAKDTLLEGSSRNSPPHLFPLAWTRTSPVGPHSTLSSSTTSTTSSGFCGVQDLEGTYHPWPPRGPGTHKPASTSSPRDLRFRFLNPCPMASHSPMPAWQSGVWTIKLPSSASPSSPRPGWPLDTILTHRLLFYSVPERVLLCSPGYL